MEIYFCVYSDLSTYIFTCPDIVSEYIRHGRYNDIRRDMGHISAIYAHKYGEFCCRNISKYVDRLYFPVGIYFCLYLQEIIIFRALRNTHTAGLFLCHKGGWSNTQLHMNFYFALFVHEFALQTPKKTLGGSNHAKDA